MRGFLSMRLPWILPALALIAGCAGEPRPVAVVEVDGGELELPYRGFVPLELAWRLEEPLRGRAGELRVFVHLLDGPGSVVRTFDHPWPGGWSPGARVDYRVRLYQSALAPPLEPGLYALSLGLYDEEGRRWPLATSGEPVDRHEYRVADVRVPPVVGGGPTLQLSPEWLESEAGPGRQILARRWLGGPGGLRAAGLEHPVQLWLRLGLPSPEDGRELVLTEGAAQQGVTVRSDCGDVEVRLAGPGAHDVTLELAPAAGDACEVEVAPNFYLLDLASAERRAVSLDVLAWAAGAGAPGS